MKRYFSILLVVLALFIYSSTSSYAAFGCQVLYGGGQVCQGQSATIKTYPPTPTPTPTSETSLSDETVPTTTTLPSTGTASWTVALLGVAGVAGVLLLLL